MALKLQPRTSKGKNTFTDWQSKIDADSRSRTPALAMVNEDCFVAESALKHEQRIHFAVAPP